VLKAKVYIITSKEPFKTLAKLLKKVVMVKEVKEVVIY
jgi:HKD family nuclease